MYPPDDYFDHIHSDDYEHFIEDGGSWRPPLTCRRCGAGDMRWCQHNGKWVLFDNAARVIHTCPRPSAEEDFGDTT